MHLRRGGGSAALRRKIALDLSKLAVYEYTDIWQHWFPYDCMLLKVRMRQVVFPSSFI
jgi:hypothetical protein